MTQMDDMNAAAILAAFATQAVVNKTSSKSSPLLSAVNKLGDHSVPGSPPHTRSPQIEPPSPARGSVKKRGPVSKLDGAYFPHKLFRIIANSKFLKWVDDGNFQICNYEGLLNEWKEQINEIKEQTMKDELRKHNFIRNRKLEKEKGAASGEIWYHREDYFRRGQPQLLESIKRKYRSTKRGRTSDDGGDIDDEGSIVPTN
eukprot:TRINITY_DN12924_c0_g1_i1.p1 TRINITY_DN12924_c0_g1~~TRINITY_DN12924_c0_g1_i1.p1  ORF type:complete len:201 (+),score=23.78 TRINITY_DN12924_c0_g1_i1:63-665(+)